MALAVSVRFSFVDGKGKTSSTKIRVPNGFSINAYLEFAQAAADTISTAIDCRITSATICIGLDLAGATLKAAATAVADIAQKGQFIFNTAVNGFRKIFRLPTFDETKVLPNSDSLDEIDADMAAFITSMENGISVGGGLGSVSPCDQRENDISALSSTRELFRGTR